MTLNTELSVIQMPSVLECQELFKIFRLTGLFLNDCILLELKYPPTEELICKPGLRFAKLYYHILAGVFFIEN